MHANRYIEFHSQVGNYYTIRTPKQGRAFDYRYSSCDLYCVGATNEIYRFNLEQGQYLEPIQSKLSGFNACEFNSEHELFACGSVEGHLECYDPRIRSLVGQIDCAVYANSNSGSSLPAISCIKFKDALNVSVGMSTGQILLFDIRSNKPYFIKDHNYNLPIKRIDFHTQNNDYILSIDKKICKIWNQHTETPSILKDTRFQSLFTNPDMQIDINHENFKNIAPLVSRLNKQNVVEDESISIENDEEEREDDDDLIDDILTSEEEEEEEEEKEKPNRKTKLVPIDTINDTDQETIRSLSFNERTKRTIDSASSHLQHRNQVPSSNKNNRKETNDDYRKNVRRAPRSRMNGRHKET
ncbi:unnamed protein product [Rotaria sp. Silwood1]|nr:unnamed protein product [Rotaria sp. Silwood1]